MEGTDRMMPWTEVNATIRFLSRGWRAGRHDITVEQVHPYVQAVVYMGADYQSVENRFAEDFNLPPEFSSNG